MTRVVSIRASFRRNKNNSKNNFAKINQTERQTTKRFIFGNIDNKCALMNCLIKFNYNIK